MSTSALTHADMLHGEPAHPEHDRRKTEDGVTTLVEAPMITVLEPDHADVLTALSAEATTLRGYPIDPASWYDAPSGLDRHRWIRTSDPAAIALVAGNRARNRHAADLELIAADAAADLLTTAVAFADRWTSLDRLELALPAGHPRSTPPGPSGSRSRPSRSPASPTVATSTSTAGCARASPPDRPAVRRPGPRAAAGR